MTRRLVVVFMLFFLMSVRAFAHVLIRAETPPSSWTGAISVRDPRVSQVFYGRVGPGRARVWFRFEGKAGDRIPFTVGVPYIKRLEGFRPSAAIIGSGLPPPPGMVDIPPGLGALVFAPREKARVFHEEFTGTTSWLVIEEEYTLPDDGRWYLLAFADDAIPAHDKLWLAIGTREAFGLADILSLFSVRRFVRDFHELGRSRREA
jgi:hypothetical protein